MLADISQKAQVFLSQNASAILTAGGVAGTVGTAVLTGRAAYKAANTIVEMEVHEIAEAEAHQDEARPISRKDKIFATWPLFLPPVGLGGATIASIIFANRISAKKAAALAAAYGISERTLQEYKEKVQEKFSIGDKRDQEIRDEIAQERVNDNPNREVIIIGGNDVLCYDMLTGRYFQSSVEKIRQAVLELHTEILNHMYVSFSHFCNEVGLPPTDYTEEVGWNSNNIPEVQFSAVQTPDQRPCMAFTFSSVPRPDYAQLY